MKTKDQKKSNQSANSGKGSPKVKSGQVKPMSSQTVEMDQIKINNVTDLTVGNNITAGRITVNRPRKEGIKRLGDPGMESIILDADKRTISMIGGYSGDEETINIDAVGGDITLGGVGAQGKLVMNNSKGKESSTLYDGNLVLGGNDTRGNITIKSLKGEQIFKLDGHTGNFTVGGPGASGDIFIKNDKDIDTIRINGTSGDIEFLNADFAEDFDVCEEVIHHVVPGSVMILNDNGKLVPCDGAYNTRVVGIVAGAGSYKPGIVMDKNGEENRLPVAMMGKVFCLADADNFPIQVGDMLTTSSRSGHAMKATDTSKAFGTVIGKALGKLSHGTGLIPVLVNLQ